MTTTKKKSIAKVRSLYDLRQLAITDGRYEQLAKVAARNLGVDVATFDQAMSWLRLNAQETSEAWVVGEINFCRDLISEESV